MGIVGLAAGGGGEGRGAGGGCRGGGGCGTGGGGRRVASWALRSVRLSVSSMARLPMALTPVSARVGGKERKGRRVGV